MNSWQPLKPISNDFEPRVCFHPAPLTLSLLFFVPSQIQTLDLLFVNVGFIHCQLRDGRREQVMHSLGLAPTPGNAGPGGTQIGLQYL